jgi:hypothetical protein
MHGLGKRRAPHVCAFQRIVQLIALHTLLLSEGYEPSVLQSLGVNRLRLPRQLSIEMHMRHAVGGIAPNNTPSMALLFYHLTILGYGEWGCQRRSLVQQ